MSDGAAPDPETRAPLGRLDAFCRAALAGAGADEPTANAATRAMLHASRHGVDSHGVRLLAHYVAAIRGGRVNGSPVLKFDRRAGAVSVLDAGHAHGARAAYAAMFHAVELAETCGIGAVGIRNTSHFGPAGAYAMTAAEAGMIGLATCNSDSFVRLHDGAERFHGTNPIAVAAPVAGERPWLFDMATSAITYNRVQLHRSTGAPLPADVASTGDGAPTTDAAAAEMLAPLGGLFGFKGAGLAGLAEILSAVLTGMRLSPDILPMPGPDMKTPREMGAFVLALNPGVFVEPLTWQRGMRRYRSLLRNSAARPGAQVMAPGDREWAEAGRREKHGVPLDPATVAAFREIAGDQGLALPFD